MAERLRLGDRVHYEPDPEDLGTVVEVGQNPMSGRYRVVVWWDTDDVDECTRHGFCEELDEPVRRATPADETSRAMVTAWRVIRAGRGRGTRRG